MSFQFSQIASCSQISIARYLKKMIVGYRCLDKQKLTYTFSSLLALAPLLLIESTTIEGVTFPYKIVLSKVNVKTNLMASFVTD